MCSCTNLTLAADEANEDTASPQCEPEPPALPSAHKVDALADLAAMIEEKAKDAAFYFDISACRSLTNTHWRAMQVATALNIFDATDPSRLCADVELPKSKCSASDHDRGFNSAHLQKFPWLAYSRTENGVYCRMCCIFLSRAPSAMPPSSMLFIKSAHKNWKNSLRDYTAHMATDHHKRAVASHAMVSHQPRTVSTLEQTLRRQAEQVVLANRDRFLAVARPLYFIAEQGLAIRGHRGESMAELTSAVRARQQATSRSSSHLAGECAADAGLALNQVATTAHESTANVKVTNPGNYLALLSFLAVHKYDPALEEIFHPTSSLRPRATYHSPEAQEEIIRILAAIVRKSLLDEIKQAPCFAILADEATDASNKQQLSLCIRFLDSKLVIREEFLGLFKPDSTSSGAAALTQAILNAVQHLRLDMSKCCGQGYDGCSTMAGQHNGVAARIMRNYPFAHYFHCSAHVLSLCVSAACVNSENSLIKNAIKQVDNIWIFFKYSPKRTDFLKSCIENMGNLPGGAAAKKTGQLKGFSPTRWVQRIDCLEEFIQFYTGIVSALHGIAYGSSAAWNKESRDTAESAYLAVTTFEFVYPILVLTDLLSQIRPTTIALQSKTLDIIAAYELVQDCVTVIDNLRGSDLARVSQHWFDKASGLITAVNGTPASIPRSARRTLFSAGSIPTFTPSAAAQGRDVVPAVTATAPSGPLPSASSGTLPTPPLPLSLQAASIELQVEAESLEPVDIPPAVAETLQCMKESSLAIEVDPSTAGLATATQSESAKRNSAAVLAGPIQKKQRRSKAADQARTDSEGKEEGAAAAAAQALDSEEDVAAVAQETPMTVHDYYRVSVAVPLLDIFLSELRTRFDSKNKRIISFLQLVPAVLLRTVPQKGMQSLADELVQSVSTLSDTIRPDLFAKEVVIWHVTWQRLSDENKDIPADLPSLLHSNYNWQPMYPEIFKAICILATLPVTTCTCERSISGLGA